MSCSTHCTPLPRDLSHRNRAVFDHAHGDPVIAPETAGIVQASEIAPIGEPIECDEAHIAAAHFSLSLTLSTFSSKVVNLVPGSANRVGVGG